MGDTSACGISFVRPDDLERGLYLVFFKHNRGTKTDEIGRRLFNHEGAFDLIGKSGDLSVQAPHAPFRLLVLGVFGKISQFAGRAHISDRLGKVVVFNPIPFLFQAVQAFLRDVEWPVVRRGLEFFRSSNREAHTR